MMHRPTAPAMAWLIPAAAIASNQEWREARPAQFSCGEGEIVAKVREVLARHDVKWN